MSPHSTLEHLPCLPSANAMRQHLPSMDTVCSDVRREFSGHSCWDRLRQRYCGKNTDDKSSVVWRFKYKRSSKPHAIYFNTTWSPGKWVGQVQLQKKQTGDEGLLCQPKGRGTVGADQVSEHWSVGKISSFVILSPGIFPCVGCLGHMRSNFSSFDDGPYWFP